MSKHAVFEYLERIEAVIRAEAWQVGRLYNLQPIQLQMLAYLGRCNRYSNNPAAVTAYFQLTKGTVSQSLKVLESRGYIARRADTQDKRKVILSLTEEGQTVVDAAYPPPLFRAINLNEADEERLTDQLQGLLHRLQRANQLETFGICHTCRYFQTEGDAQFRCGLTQEVLHSHEADLICREHRETT
ncbi:MAG: MarR family winged helix-turn-helix transcriptional regulator [Ardenticatenaceae bacterium]|nr:MarR family winged helix-turn-helix transcriptional regulator [Ardenticatenaceae bacterium]